VYTCQRCIIRVFRFFVFRLLITYSHLLPSDHTRQYRVPQTRLYTVLRYVLYRFDRCSETADSILLYNCYYTHDHFVAVERLRVLRHLDERSDGVLAGSGRSGLDQEPDEVVVRPRRGEGDADS